MILVSINQAVYKELSYNLRMEVGANTRRNFTYQEWILQRFCMAIDSRFTPLWISSTICIWLYCTIIPDVKSLDGPSGPEKDFTDLHAWVEVYLPGGVD
jgi:hypothetical protein